MLTLWCAQWEFGYASRKWHGTEICTHACFLLVQGHRRSRRRGETGRGGSC
jgi:hypothetical protein